MFRGLGLRGWGLGSEGLTVRPAATLTAACKPYMFRV